MDAGAMAAFLDAKHYCVLATARPNGRPQARPVGFTVFAGSFWIATVGGQRLENLRTTPYASLVVMEGEHGDHRMVLAEGSVVVQNAMPDALEGVWIERHGRSPDWAVAFVALSPERVFSYDASM